MINVKNSGTGRWGFFLTTKACKIYSRAQLKITFPQRQIPATLLARCREQVSKTNTKELCLIDSLLGQHGKHAPLGPKNNTKYYAAFKYFACEQSYESFSEIIWNAHPVMFSSSDVTVYCVSVTYKHTGGITGRYKNIITSMNSRLKAIRFHSQANSVKNNKENQSKSPNGCLHPRRSLDRLKM